jgi:antitoxin (DNA-binding transcriptional repressor) of toxin-antitoxin stability system
MGLRLEVSELAGRLADIERTVDAGHDVTLLRDGEPWATITPM